VTSTSDDVHLRAMVDRWPLVGRDDLVERLSGWLGDGSQQGIVIVGDAGYGKTALAKAVLEAAGDRVYVVVLNAWPGAAGVPYAALSNVLVDLPAVEAEGPLAVARAVAGYIDERRGDRPCIVWVDDAHDVDDDSARVLARLVLADKIRLLLGSRPSADLPEPLAVRLRGRTERIELQPLTEAQVSQVLASVLGAPPTLGATRQIWRASNGNPLYIRELVRDALRGGNLVQHEGLWVWRGPDAEAGVHLREMVAAQLASRPAAQREALELVALAEPVAVPVLLNVVAHADLDVLEREHLVVVDGHSPPTVRLAHPIYGEAVRALVPTGRRVELRQRMVAALEDATDDPLLALMRSVGWALDCGIDVQPERLVRAAELANRSHDYVFAARAAKAGLGTAVDHRARLELAFAYRFIGRVDDALAALEAGEPQGPEEQVELLLGRANLLQYGLDRVDEAMACLAEAIEVAPSAAHRRAVVARRFVHSVYGAFGAEHRDEGEALLADPDTPAQIRNEIAPSVALLRTLAGHSESGLELLGQMLPNMRPSADRNPWTAEELLYMTGAISLMRASEVVSTEVAGQAIAGVDPSVRFDPGMEELGDGWAKLNAGCMTAAASLLTAALASFTAHDTSGFRGLTLALAAEAAAVAGDHERAFSLAAECRGVRLRTSRMLAGQLERALLWPTAIANGFERAVTEAHDLADRLLARGEVASAAHVLHDAIRLGDSDAAPRAAELARWCDLPRLRACGMHADGLVDGDGQALVAAAEAFDALGMRLHAAEVWSDAAEAFRAAGLRDSTRRATAAVALAAAELGRAHTPRLLRNAGAQPLTRREVEIASLASRMLSNSEIARLLGLGRRTVEGHLHRAYGKLGVSSREELAALLL
jgi:DNA-binding CsgD family transcriptional regulator/type II secretory pathway predicted ATPase ExeA